MKKNDGGYDRGRDLEGRELDNQRKREKRDRKLNEEENLKEDKTDCRCQFLL